LLSNNQFDRSVEAGMTAAFVVGPAGAVAGLVAGVILGKKKRMSWVNNGPAAPETRLPLYRRDRTLPSRPATSVSCREETHAPP
jgi:hypothetical protein